MSLHALLTEYWQRRIMSVVASASARSDKLFRHFSRSTCVPAVFLPPAWYTAARLRSFPVASDKRKRMKSRGFFLGALVAALWVSPHAVEAQTGTIRGKVTNEVSGLPLA